jgi:hypothetical protein
MTRKTSLVLTMMATFAIGCDQDGDGFSDAADCGPDSADIHPGAEEICDGIDNNCDGVIDEGVTLVFYGDSDGDGYGSADLRVEACEATDTLLADNTDCDDTDPNSYPGAAEVCDGIDNNCDNLVDTDDPSVDLSTAGTWYRDADHDGYGNPDASVESCDVPAGHVDNGDDCDDNSSDIHPNLVWYGDLDGDGYGDDTYTLTQCETPDGFVRVGGDCDEYDVEVNPAAIEYCDEIDNNCDGDIDEDASVDALTWYQDDDDDQFGTATEAIACYEPEGFTAETGDCDDADDTAYPGAFENCDGVDNDCDTLVDFTYSVPTDFGTIAAAIAAVDEGDSFCVEAGTHYTYGLYTAKDVGIVGEGSSTIIDASGTQGLYVDGATVELRNLTVTNAWSDTGAVLEADDATVLIDSVDVTSSGASGSYVYGGAFYTEDTELTVSNTTIDSFDADCQYYLYGGIGYFGGSTVNFTDVSVTNATIDTSYYLYGGLFYVYDTALSLSGFEATDNVSNTYYRTYGSTFYIEDDTTLAVDDSEFSTNTSLATVYSSGDLSGAWYVSGSDIDVDVTNTRIADNELIAADDNYAYFYISYLYEGTVDLENVQLTGNTLGSQSSGFGYGMFYSYYGETSLTNVDIVDNDLTSLGSLYGLFYRSYSADVTVLNSNLVGNLADNAYAGVMYSSYGNDDGYGEFSMNYSNAYDNWASFAYGYDWYDGGNEGDLADFTGNIADDPLYTDAANGDFTLGSGSPAIDAGSPDLLDTDGTTSDIGSFGGPNASL